MMLASLFGRQLAIAAEPSPLKLRWEDNFLTISGPPLGGRRVRVHYLEAYCRDGSTNREWSQTVIGHRTRLVSSARDGSKLELHCTLSDGVVVQHAIATRRINERMDAVDFRLLAENPTPQLSRAHWAQPCIRVGEFTGKSQEDYVPHCFVFIDRRLTRLPTMPWATQALYTPGQVYCPAHVDRQDVNPRPLSSLVPSNGLMGCFSKDERQILAAAWEPYQELFQGVGVCIHSDFRIGGLQPGERKHIRGTIYLTTAGADALAEHYEAEFPEHVARN